MYPTYHVHESSCTSGCRNCQLRLSVLTNRCCLLIVHDYRAVVFRTVDHAHGSLLAHRDQPHPRQELDHLWYNGLRAPAQRGVSASLQLVPQITWFNAAYHRTAALCSSTCSSRSSSSSLSSGSTATTRTWRRFPTHARRTVCAEIGLRGWWATASWYTSSSPLTQCLTCRIRLSRASMVRLLSHGDI
eukprot:SAG11_NODE_288_length_11198_cov_29.339130_6_plen_188_part_00